MSITYVGNILTDGVLDASFSSGMNEQSTTIEASPPTLDTGDVFVLAVLMENDTLKSPTYVSDPRGNTYSLLAQITDSSISTTLAIVATAMNTVVQAGDTITFYETNGNPMLAVGFVLRGASITLDQTYEDTTGAYNSAWTTPAVDTAEEPDAFISIGAASVSITSFTDTPISGMTDVIAHAGTNVARSIVVQYGITSSTGDVNGGGTFESSGTATDESYCSLGLALQAASSGFTETFTAGLSFVGADQKATVSTLAAGLSFTGKALKSTAASLTAGLSFAGRALKGTARSLTAGLAFTGAAAKQTAQTFTAGLSFVGIWGALTGISVLFTAGLSFVGAQSKATARTVSAALSFTGAFSVSALLQLLLTASVAFAGTVRKATTRSLSASLSVTGQIGKRLARAYRAALGLAGSLGSSAAGGTPGICEPTAVQFYQYVSAVTIPAYSSRASVVECDCGCM